MNNMKNNEIHINYSSVRFFTFISFIFICNFIILNNKKIMANLDELYLIHLLKNP